MSQIHPAFHPHQPAFTSITGTSPTLEVLIENTKYPFAHEAGVYVESEDSLYVTSNQFPDQDTKPQVQISKIKISRGRNGPQNSIASGAQEEINTSSVPMANGGHRYKNGIIFCAQGHLDNTPGGIAYMDLTPPYASQLLVTGFHGRAFNSVNDLVVHDDGSIWFTDPCYGFEQGFRPEPQLPNQVYRFDPASGDVRAVADGFGRPNGLCFSPEQEILYVTDTDFIHGDGSTDLSRVSSIYAFDVKTYSGQPFLCNRRLFAMADAGVPDGIKCDKQGNVYSGCGDGVHVWSPGGVLLGKILVDGGVANFCFGRDGELFLLNENRIWWARIKDEVGSCVNFDSSAGSNRPAKM